MRIIQPPLAGMGQMLWIVLLCCLSCGMWLFCCHHKAPKRAQFCLCCPVIIISSRFCCSRQIYSSALEAGRGMSSSFWPSNSNPKHDAESTFHTRFYHSHFHSHWHIRTVILSAVMKEKKKSRLEFIREKHPPVIYGPVLHWQWFLQQRLVVINHRVVRGSSVRDNEQWLPESPGACRQWTSNLCLWVHKIGLTYFTNIKQKIAYYVGD